jgi:hypothetical protein
MFGEQDYTSPDPPSLRFLKARLKATNKRRHLTLFTVVFIDSEARLQPSSQPSGSSEPSTLSQTAMTIHQYWRYN